MKANDISLVSKIVAVGLVVVSTILKGLGIIDINLTEILTAVVGIEAAVLPIDISKIKEAGHAKD